MEFSIESLAVQKQARLNSTYLERDLIPPI